MANIVGIGGVFLFSRDPDSLAGWYQHHLGFSLRRLVEADQSITYYQELYYRDIDAPDKKLHTVFAIMTEKSEISKQRNQAMINYRVDDLDAFVERLHSEGVSTEAVQVLEDAEGKGKFTHLFDLDGNRIELWQHIDQ